MSIEVLHYKLNNSFGVQLTRDTGGLYLIQFDLKWMQLIAYWQGI